MGENSRKQRRTDRTLDVIRADAKAARQLNPQGRTLVRRFQMTFIILAMAGLAWPAGLNIFADIRGEITHPPVGHGKYRFARVATGWPDFTAPWPIPAAILIALVIATGVLLLRRRTLIPHLMLPMNFAWLCVGAGITFTAFMYFGADGWPLWHAWFGIPTVVVGGMLWLLNRRRENELLRGSRRRQ